MPTYRTKEPIVIRNFRGGSNQDYPEFTIPKGLRCKPTGMPGKFWLDTLPGNIFPAGSGLRHDADHYGIVLDEACVEVTQDPLPPDWTSGKPLTVEALQVAMEEAEVPYATAQRSGKLLVLYLTFTGCFRVAYDSHTVHLGADPQKALDVFTTFKP